MEWFHHARVQAEAQGHHFTLSGPVSEDVLRQCGRRLPFAVPTDLRQFLAKTPEGAASYLAITRVGQIVDLWGLPNRERTEPKCPTFRGVWRIIAPSFDALLMRMFQAEEPLFWL